MKIRWLGHAAFAIESNGLRVITDPYTPEDLDFPPVTESADIVIRSSADDRGHCNAEMIPGSPVVVTATEIVEKGANVRGLSTMRCIALSWRESRCATWEMWAIV